MAAPHVSGAAAMLMARYTELIGEPRRIKRILCESATDLGRERSFQGTGCWTCSALSRKSREGGTMIFSLDVRRARKGDCLLVHYGSEGDPGLALIDGGPAQVYKPHLKPRLTQIRKARGLGNDESLAVDLLMVSHIDDDHINGILELTNELVSAKDSRTAITAEGPQLLAQHVRRHHRQQTGGAAGGGDGLIWSCSAKRRA